MPAAGTKGRFVLHVTIPNYLRNLPVKYELLLQYKVMILFTHSSFLLHYLQLEQVLQQKDIHHH
ncbi:hypothetical protein I79_000348 [Cricetulus griseus]|uniref:Uncharacterized protein n=1 Tax=Cricetulus griseus TaxID=10029 RepID=G3GS38_CRIGR|nr:hypothetical protein I79_000348 [Cricetulus griseus]